MKECDCKKQQTKVMPLLQKEMEKCGYISQEAIEKISETTKVSCAEIYGVVTFYSQFRLKPKAKHSISICTGTACFVLGAQDILDRILGKLKVQVGEMTSDGKWIVTNVELVDISHFGGWGEATKKHFADGGIFDKIYEKK